MTSSAAVFFRIIYATAYLFLHVLLLVLLLVTPGDIINQSRDRHDIVSILIVAACYIFAILVVIFVFFLRLFLKRAVLNSIPRSWIPIEKGEVSKPVRSMISAGLSRSAAIAFVSRPRVVPKELLDEMCPMLVAGALIPGSSGAQEGAALQGGEKEDEAALRGSVPKTEKAVRFKRVETMEMEKELGIDLPPCQAVWGEIEHPGWAPPDRPLCRPGARAAGGGGGGGGGGGAAAGSPNPLDENINLQYSVVLAELPNLIEAKAMTLAPPDPMSASDPPMLDAEAVSLLERPLYMGLREYIAHLAGLGVIDLHAEAPVYDKGAAADGDPRLLGAVVSSFAASYEYARFSTHMISHKTFRQLMHDLATILRRMTPLDPGVLDDYDEDADDDERDDGYSYSESDNRSGRLYFAGDSEQDGYGDIDNNAARSSPTTPGRSRGRSSGAHLLTSQRRQQTQTHTYDFSPQNARHLTMSRSASSRRSVITSSSSSSNSSGTGSSSSSSSGKSQGSDGTSRRRRRPRRQTTAPPLADEDGRDTSPSVGAWDQRRQGKGGRRPLLAPRRPSSRASSANSFAQTRQPYAVSNQPSSASLRSTASSGSVIRLADRNEEASLGLPYVITTQTEDERLF
ncbi:hypothetical protein SCUCBS95973_001658 [Sporothrix curviconia]|uniref:Defect at low temperature protein 1 n=1 Tax=Sporothrix curviconia TaxID=1260050 RepID=A0ABP0B0F0_9PEZI